MSSTSATPKTNTSQTGSLPEGSPPLTRSNAKILYTNPRSSTDAKIRAAYLAKTEARKKSGLRF